MKSPATPPRSAFTLVELLVVIVIIGILASLGTVAAINAINSAKNARITMELNNLDMAIKSLASDLGAENSYPPSDFSDAHLSTSKFKKFAARAFPRRATSGAMSDIITLPIPWETSNAADGPGPEEMLFFWLGNEIKDPVAGTTWRGGFSSDPRKPFTGSGPTSRFDFDRTRLRDEDADGFPEYYPPGCEQPYVYFDSRSYVDHHANPITTSAGFAARPYNSDLNENTDTVIDIADFVNHDKFQIIASGLDNKFTNAAAKAQVQYPSGKGYTIEDDDNLTNFSGRKLGDAKP